MFDARGKLRLASKAALARKNPRFDLSIVLSRLPAMTRGTKSIDGFICSVCLRCLSITFNLPIALQPAARIALGSKVVPSHAQEEIYF
jgi:hypothetical protein